MWCCNPFIPVFFLLLFPVPKNLNPAIISGTVENKRQIMINHLISRIIWRLPSLFPRVRIASSLMWFSKEAILILESGPGSYSPWRHIQHSQKLSNWSLTIRCSLVSNPGKYFYVINRWYPNRYHYSSQSGSGSYCPWRHIQHSQKLTNWSLTIRCSLVSNPGKYFYVINRWYPNRYHYSSQSGPGSYCPWRHIQHSPKLSNWSLTIRCSLVSNPGKYFYMINRWYPNRYHYSSQSGPGSYCPWRHIQHSQKLTNWSLTIRCSLVSNPGKYFYMINRWYPNRYHYSSQSGPGSYCPWRHIQHSQKLTNWSLTIRCSLVSNPGKYFYMINRWYPNRYHYSSQSGPGSYCPWRHIQHSQKLTNWSLTIRCSLVSNPGKYFYMINRWYPNRYHYSSQSGPGSYCPWIHIQHSQKLSNWSLTIRCSLVSNPGKYFYVINRWYPNRYHYSSQSGPGSYCPWRHIQHSQKLTNWSLTIRCSLVSNPGKYFYMINRWYPNRYHYSSQSGPGSYCPWRHIQHSQKLTNWSLTIRCSLVSNPGKYFYVINRWYPNRYHYSSQSGPGSYCPWRHIQHSQKLTNWSLTIRCSLVSNPGKYLYVINRWYPNRYHYSSQSGPGSYCPWRHIQHSQKLTNWSLTIRCSLLSNPGKYFYMINRWYPNRYHYSSQSGPGSYCPWRHIQHSQKLTNWSLTIRCSLVSNPGKYFYVINRWYPNRYHYSSQSGPGSYCPWRHIQHSQKLTNWSLTIRCSLVSNPGKYFYVINRWYPNRYHYSSQSGPGSYCPWRHIQHSQKLTNWSLTIRCSLVSNPGKYLYVINRSYPNRYHYLSQSGSGSYCPWRHIQHSQKLKNWSLTIRCSLVSNPGKYFYVINRWYPNRYHYSSQSGPGSYCPWRHIQHSQKLTNWSLTIRCSLVSNPGKYFYMINRWYPNWYHYSSQSGPGSYCPWRHIQHSQKLTNWSLTIRCSLVSNPGKYLYVINRWCPNRYHYSSQSGPGSYCPWRHIQHSQKLKNWSLTIRCSLVSNPGKYFYVINRWYPNRYHYSSQSGPGSYCPWRHIQHSQKLTNWSLTIWCSLVSNPRKYFYLINRWYHKR